MAPESTPHQEPSRGRAILLTRVEAIVGPAALGAVALLLLVVTLRFVATAALDSRMVAIFSSDEEFIANGLERMITRKSLNYGFWWYPGCFMMVSLPVYAALRLFGVAGPMAVVVAPRLVTGIAYAAAAVLTALLTRRLSRSWIAALAAALLLATTTDVYVFGVTAHPDTLQLVFLVVSVWLLVDYVEYLQPRRLWLASAVAGLAFATKYAGAFLVPILGLAALWANVRRGLTLRAAIGQTLRRDAPRAAGAFVAAVAVGAPSFFFNLSPFYKKIQHHNHTSTYGWFGREERSPLHWLNIMAEPNVVGTLVMVLFVVSLAAIALWAWRERRTLLTLPQTLPVDDTAKPALAGYVLVAAYTCLYLGLMLARTRLFEIRYLYPALPGLLALATGTGWNVADRMPRLVRPVAQVGLAVLLAVVLPVRAAALGDVAAERASRNAHPCFEVGRWLRDHVPTDTLVLYDQYTYVPREYAVGASTWGLTSESIDRLRPGIVITNDEIRQLYRMSVKPEEWRLGKEWFLDARESYRRLESHELPYRLLAVFPACQDTRIYGWQGVSRPTTAGH